MKEKDTHVQTEYTPTHTHIRMYKSINIGIVKQNHDTKLMYTVLSNLKFIEAFMGCKINGENSTHYDVTM